MTWTCPNCGRDYPDSGIRVILDRDERGDDHCAECVVGEDEIEEIVDEWRKRLEGMNKNGQTNLQLERCLQDFEAVTD